MKRVHPPLLLLLSACSISAPVDYYDGRWDPPTITELLVDRQPGNVSGSSVVIYGSGFGSDPTEVMVQFGSANAKVLSVKDGEIIVLAPPGPVGGGDVPVRVGTYTGYATGRYSYQMGDEVTPGVGDEVLDEVGYVLVSNFWESCYGGLSDRLEGKYGVTDCTSLAYIGSTGLSGQAEAIEFAARRKYAPSQGFYGGTDMAGALLDVVTSDILLTRDETYVAESTFKVAGDEISGLFFVMPSEGLLDALTNARVAA